MPRREPGAQGSYRGVCPVENRGLTRRPHFSSPERKRGCRITSSRKRAHCVRLLKSRWLEISASSATSSGAYAGEYVSTCFPNLRRASRASHRPDAQQPSSRGSRTSKQGQQEKPFRASTMRHPAASATSLRIRALRSRAVWLMTKADIKQRQPKRFPTICE